jgi:hypothetical protein
MAIFKEGSSKIYPKPPEILVISKLFSLKCDDFLKIFQKVSLTMLLWTFLFGKMVKFQHQKNHWSESVI